MFYFIKSKKLIFFYCLNRSINYPRIYPQSFRNQFRMFIFMILKISGRDSKKSVRAIEPNRSLFSLVVSRWAKKAVKKVFFNHLYSTIKSNWKNIHIFLFKLKKLIISRFFLLFRSPTRRKIYENWKHFDFFISDKNCELNLFRHCSGKALQESADKSAISWNVMRNKLFCTFRMYV